MDFNFTKSFFLNIFYCSLFYLFATNKCHAQWPIKQTHQAIIDLTSISETYSVIPLEDAGVMIHRLYQVGDSLQLEATVLDTLLQPIWRKGLSLDKNYSFINSTKWRNKIHFLLCKSTTLQKEYTIVTVDNDTEKFYVTTFSISKELSFNQFYANSKGLIFPCIVNNLLVIIFHNFKTGKQHVLPSNLNSRCNLQSVQIRDDNSFDLIVSHKNSQHYPTYSILSFSDDGLNQGFVELPSYKKFNLYSAHMQYCKNNSLVITGVYKPWGSKAFDGIYIATIYPDYSNHITYNSFTNLKSMHSYTLNGNTKLFKRFSERRTSSGKQTRLMHNFAITGFIAGPESFVISGLGFTNYDKTTSNYTRPHASLIRLNYDASVLEDYSSDISSLSAGIVKSNQRSNSIYSIALTENILIINALNNGSFTNIANLKVMLPVDGDRTTTELKDWYQNYFLVYGVQEINDSGKNESERIFFINKVKCN